MIACYDLAKCPPTYDVVTFLAQAELERLRVGDPSIDIHILLGPNGGFRNDKLWPQDINMRWHLLKNVVVPLCKLLPSVSYVDTSPRSALTKPNCYGAGQYLVGFPNMMSTLRRGCRPLRAPQPVARNGGYITFTLREAEHHPRRNSRTGEWVCAARELQERNFTVIVVRDTAQVDVRLPGVDTAGPEFSRDLSRRADLYARATLNVGICNGPMWMSIYMNAPTLMLRPTTNSAGGCYDDAFYRRFGLERGAQLPSSPPHQRLVWEEDRAEVIVREVERMMDSLAGGHAQLERHAV